MPKPITTTPAKVWVFWDYDCCCGGGSSASGPTAVFHDETHADKYQQVHPDLHREVLTDDGDPGHITTEYTAKTSCHSPYTATINGVTHHQWRRDDYDTEAPRFGALNLTVTESAPPKADTCTSDYWSVVAVGPDPTEARRACDEAVRARMELLGIDPEQLKSHCPHCSDKEDR